MDQVTIWVDTLNGVWQRGLYRAFSFPDPNADLGTGMIQIYPTNPMVKLTQVRPPEKSNSVLALVIQEEQELGRLEINPLFGYAIRVKVGTKSRIRGGVDLSPENAQARTREGLRNVRVVSHTPLPQTVLGGLCTAALLLEMQVHGELQGVA